MILDPSIYEKASHDTALAMTMELRGKATNAGWHPEVVSNISVKHDNGKFSVHVHPDYEDRAKFHEYGSEGVKPSAVIRKYNRPDAGSDAFMRSLKHHAKGEK
jgi:hypothetical protein